MTQDHDAVIQYVSVYCKEFPEIIPKLIDAMTRATRDRLDEEAHKRSEIECALIAALMKKSKSADSLLVNKLKVIQQFGSMNYESVINEIEERRK
jgi:hypothetical protein